MADLDPSHDDHNPESQKRNARQGLMLFFPYLFLYGGFVYLSAFSRETMAQVYGGVNLAIWYGMGLIVSALILALVYMFLCRTK